MVSGPEIANETGMSFGPLLGIASSCIGSLFGGGASASPATAGAGAPNAQAANQVSPFERILRGLEQLHQANLPEYRQVTQAISANLQSAAQKATASGNTGLAKELSRLSGDFSSAAGNGQLPNVQDLSQAAGSGPRHFLHHQPLNIVESTMAAAGVQSL